MRKNNVRKERTRALWGEMFMPRALGSAGIAGLGIAMILSVHDITITDGMRYHLVFWTGIGNIVLGIVFYFVFTFKFAFSAISSAIRAKSPDSWLGRTFTYSYKEETVGTFSASARLRTIVSICFISPVLFWIGIFKRNKTICVSRHYVWRS